MGGKINSRKGSCNYKTAIYAYKHYLYVTVTTLNSVVKKLISQCNFIKTCYKTTKKIIKTGMAIWTVKRNLLNCEMEISKF